MSSVEVNPIIHLSQSLQNLTMTMDKTEGNRLIYWIATWDGVLFKFDFGIHSPFHGTNFEAISEEDRFYNLPLLPCQNQQSAAATTKETLQTHRLMIRCSFLLLVPT